MMKLLSNFLQKLEIEKVSTDMTIEKARHIVNEINMFLYTNYDDIGTTNILGENFKYFSDFHKFWHDHYKDILNIEINNEKCNLVADELHNIYMKTDGKVFKEIYDTFGLSKENICKVRLLTANQDFRGSRKFSDLASIFNDDPTIFDEKKIIESPEDFIKSIDTTSLSQNDKRLNYAKNICKFLINFNSTPFGIINEFGRNVFDFRKALIDSYSGYGNKKADMFIRDMVVLNVWDNVSGFDKIDVASDVNTIKVALRTGIVKTAIPLVSSFLDIFCYQYGYMDAMNAQAWRKVWDVWKNKYPNECIQSPCLIDYFVYNVIGKQFCKNILCYFKCDENEQHLFPWHSSRNRTCQICYKEGNLGSKATLVNKVMPCLDPNGSIAIRNTDFVKENRDIDMEECPFHNICNEENKKLQPPKSISIIGQTGWTSAYAKKGEGGGGLMS